MKLGLVLEGGASRGYFSVGVMDLLMDENIWADYVIGTSAGIANGVSYVSRQRGRSLKIGTELLPTPKYMGKHHLLRPHNRSYYNIEYVFDEIPNKILPFDYAAYAPHAEQTIAALTNIETGEAEYWPVPADDRSWKAVVASCALPMLFQPVEINGKKYMDGGIVDSIPVRQALAADCDRVIVVLTRERSYVKQPEKALTIAEKLYHRYPKLVQALEKRTDAYNRNREDVFSLEQEGRVFVIAPQNTTSWHRTEKNPVQIQAFYDSGYHEAKVQLGALRAYLQ
ncbi:MAG: patatin family protein [Oscillospiraceae bacterium]|nr:patatin family protein [Oscillospiraceae bacterium]